MKFITLIFKFIFLVLALSLKALWSTLVWVFHFIDGGKETDSYSEADHVINYNYRTAELDAVKRPDGLYEDR